MEYSGGRQRHGLSRRWHLQRQRPAILYAQWVPGANGTWIQTTAGPFNWGDTANWSGGTVAAGADRTANFTPNFTATQTVNLESARTIGNITFTDSTTSSNDLTISGANTLTLSRTSGTPAINVTQSGRALTISSVIAGSNGLQKSGAGTLIFNSSSNNTFTGGLEINAGTVQYDSTTNANAWGAAGNIITFTGDAALYNSNNAYTLARGITVNSGVTASMTGAFGESTVVSGVVSGSGTLKMEGFSNGWALTLSNTANTFTGPVQILGGSGTSTLSVASLGASANAITLSNTSNAGVFIYTGSTAVSRPFVMAGTTGGSTINASGAGALTASTFSVTGAGAKLLTLDGSSGATNQISSNIVNNGGNTSVTKTGSGNWALNGSGNNFTGTITFTGTTASGGKLSYASASGTNPITFNATTGFGSTLTYTGASPLAMSGLIQASALTTGGILFEANGTVPTATINYSNASSLNSTSNSTGTRYITFGGTNSGDNTFAGTINNNTGVNGSTQVAKVDAGKWVLTGSGNYTGGIFINSGTVSVNSIPNGSSNSPLGANTRINLGRDNTTGTLIYTGAGNSSNRDLRLGGPSNASGTGGSSILNDGTGALTFTAVTFNAAQTGILFNRTLTLGGSYTGAANEIQGIIQNNTASTGLVNLDKTGASTWKLSGANTYTGTTTVSAGILELGANNVLPNTSAISVGTATLNVSTFTDTAGTLNTTGAAVINLGSGSALAFANSAAMDWTGGSLNITGTFVSGSSLRFGTSITGLSNAQLALISKPGGGPVALDSNGYLVDAPALTLTGAPVIAVNTTYGIPSPTPIRFSVSGSNLTPASGNLTVAALSGFEYSTSVGGTYTATLLIPYTGGVLSSTDVFVRLAANVSVAGSPYSGNISVSGGGAAPKTIATVSRIVSKATPTVTVTVGSYTYNGSAQGPTAYTTSPTGDTGTPTWSYAGIGGTTYGPSATRPTGAGTFTATLALAADSNFNAGSSSATAFTIANGNPYLAWAGAGAFDADANNDGVANGLAWVLGATNPSANAIGLLPTFNNTTDPTYFIYTYRRSDAANTDAKTTIAVQYGSDLSGWTTATHDGTNIIITPTNNFYGTSPRIDKVDMKIKRTLATGKLFSRLNVVIAP